MTIDIRSIAVTTYIASGLLRDEEGRFTLPFYAHTRADNRVEAMARIVAAAPRGALIRSVHPL